MSGTRSPECPTECPTESCLCAHSACDLAWIFGQDTHTINTVKYSVQTQLRVQYIHRHLPVPRGCRPAYINTIVKMPCSLSYRAARTNAETSYLQYARVRFAHPDSIHLQHGYQTLFSQRSSSRSFALLLSSGFHFSIFLTKSKNNFFSSPSSRFSASSKFIFGTSVAPRQFPVARWINKTLVNANRIQWDTPFSSNQFCTRSPFVRLRNSFGGGPSKATMWDR